MLYTNVAAVVAQLGERSTEDAEVGCSIHPDGSSMHVLLATAQVMSVYMTWYPLFIQGRSRARSYHAESTRSLLHTEVKRHRARLVVRWGTTREVLVLRSSFFVFLFHFVPTVQVIDLVSLVHPRAQSSAIISCRIHPFPSAHGS